jgi:hypothetical protein
LTALPDDSNATAHGAPLEQIHAAEHMAGGFATTTRAATPASYMYLSCPLATFPELAQDVDPFDFMVVPREWRPPSKGEGESESESESESEGEGGEHEPGRFDPSRHDINLWMGTAGVTAQTHYDCSHNLYVQVRSPRHSASAWAATESHTHHRTRTRTTAHAHAPPHTTCAGAWHEVVHSVAAIRAREAAPVPGASPVEAAVAGGLLGRARPPPLRLRQL